MRLPPPLVTAAAAVVEVLVAADAVDLDVRGAQVVQVGAGAGRLPKSPWDLAHMCSRFQLPTSPPLRDLLREMPLYSSFTLLLLFGSWSVTFRASQTAEYEIFVWGLMIVCREDFRLVPVLPIAFL